MSLQDPIADMLTRIRNAQMANLPDLSFSSSKLKLAVLAVLKEEGYIEDFYLSDDVAKPIVSVKLRYHKNKPVIEKIKKVTRPGLRIYAPVTQLPKVMNGLGVAIISTSQGLMSDRKARLLGLGGEVLITVY